jgi:ADP-ribosylglycohydrolase
MASLTTTILQDRFRGTLLGAFVGDALGAPVELLSASDIAIDPLFAKTGVRDMVSQLQLQSWIDKAAMLGMTMTDLAASNPTRPAGHYTDDTLLLFSLAEAIIASNGNPPDNATAASCAVAAWRENEKSSLAGLRGFGSGTQQVIEALAAGTVSPDTSGTMARPEGSNRNGGPMRIAPIGLIFANRDLNDMEVVKELRMAVTEAIRATHDNVEAVDGAVAVAYVVARAASSMDFNEMKADGRKLLTFLATEVCSEDFD